MAKRKLTPTQRQAIRVSIKRQLAAGQKPSEITKLLAKKYSIAPISARWYLRSVTKPSSKRKTSPAKQKPANPGRKANVRIASSGALSLVDFMQSKAAKAFQKAKEAKRLLPRWQALVRKEGLLEATRVKVERALRGIRKRAGAIGSRIKSLVGS